MTLLVLYGVLAIGVSFLCSLLEASLLSVPRGHVEVLAESGHRMGKLLKRMKDDIDRPLAAILTLNTIAHTVGAAGVGAEVGMLYGDVWVGFASGVMTLLILVLSEIIPKTLGAVHAKSLSSFTAATTQFLMWICLPLLFLLEQMNRLIGGKKQEQISRAELATTLRMGHEGGALSADELRVAQNVLALRGVRVEKILTPRTVVFAIQADEKIVEVLEKHRPIRFSRIPIYDATLDGADRYVTRHDLRHAIDMGRGEDSVASIARPMPHVPELATVSDALGQALSSRHQIMSVVDEYGGLAGIVTLEDLIETLLGIEIVDETDPAVDMQDVAKRLAGRGKA
jgi:CBS domain containing-hemolysin-like protein